MGKQAGVCALVLLFSLLGGMGFGLFNPGARKHARPAGVFSVPVAFGDNSSSDNSGGDNSSCGALPSTFASRISLESIAAAPLADNSGDSDNGGNSDNGGDSDN